MGSLSRTVPALALTPLLALGCAAGARGPANGAEVGALAAAWVSPNCFVADTTAPTADTLYTIGGVRSSTDRDRSSGPRSVACAGVRVRSGAAPVVVGLDVPTALDLRDVLELGAPARGGRRPDVVVTADADVIAYARGRAELLVEALPWSATYVLLPAGHGPALNGPALPSAETREALAGDAVTADARGAAEPFAWLRDPRCGLPSGRTPTTTAPPVIAYAEGDATARQLAARIVSLAASDTPPAWLAAATGGQVRARVLRISSMPADSVPTTLADGRAVAGVLAIARDPRRHCGTWDDTRVPTGAIPLVDTRVHVIVRRGSGAAFLVTPDGSLHFVQRASR